MQNFLYQTAHKYSLVSTPSYSVLNNSLDKVYQSNLLRSNNGTLHSSEKINKPSTGRLMACLHYNIGFSKKTKKGFGWDNSQSQLQNISFQRNIVELINQHGNDIEKNYKEINDLINQEQSQKQLFQHYIQTLQKSVIQQPAKEFCMTIKNLYWEHKIHSEIFQSQFQNSKQGLFADLLKSTFSILRSNPHLNKGVHFDYSQYPLSKLQQIALRFIELHNDSESHPQKYRSYYNNSSGSGPKLYGDEGCFSHWCSLQMYFEMRMRNCSVKEYIRLLYIGMVTYDFYQFDRAFLDSLVSGVRSQVPLMTEQQLMQLFYVVSSRIREGFMRKHFQSFYKMKKEKKPQKKSSPPPGQKETPFFDNNLLYKLQESILNKIIEKYSKKYTQNQFASTSVAFKEQDLVKIMFWIRQCLIYKNCSKSNFSEPYRFAAKLLKILIERHQKTIYLEYSPVAPGKNSSKTTLLPSTCKFSRFQQSDNLVFVISLLNLCQQFINSQEQELSTQQQLIGLFNLREGIHSVSVRVIQENKERLLNLFQKYTQSEDVNLSQSFSLTKLVRITLTEANEQFKDERQQMIDLFYSVNQKVVSLTQKENELTAEQRNLIPLICQQLLKIGYFLWNDKRHAQKYQNLKHMLNFSETYQSIIKGFKLQVQQGASASVRAENKLLTRNPEIITSIIFVELHEYFRHFASRTKQQFQDKVAHFYKQQPKLSQRDSDNYQEIVNESLLEQLIQKVFKSKEIIIDYGEALLGTATVSDSDFSQVDFDETPMRLYVRELQWPIFNYFKLLQLTLVQYLNVCKNSISTTYQNTQYEDDDLASKLSQHNGFAKYVPFTKRLDALLKIMYNRNEKADIYLKNQKQSASSTIFFSRALLPVSNDMQAKQKLAEEQKEGQQLGNNILAFLKKQKFQLERDEALTTFVKFFSEIKAFNIKFACPVTNFNVSSQFVYQDPKTKVSHVLNFLSAEQLEKKSADIEKLMLQVNGQKCDIISRQKFIKMQTGQRVQFLTSILRKSASRAELVGQQSKKVNQLT